MNHPFLWLASYPRSGNTLLRQILWQCFGVRSGSVYPNDLGGNEAMEQATGHVEHPRHGGAVHCSGPTKTHEHPPDGEQPTIYVIRDGREACVSFWRYCQTHGNPGCTLRDAIRGTAWCGAGARFGSWGDHVRAWSPKTRSDTLLLRYEQIKPDDDGGIMLTTISAIGDFLGIDHKADEIIPFSELQSADPTMLRSATNETWRDLMSAGDLQLFNQLHSDFMAEYGYGRVCTR